MSLRKHSGPMQRKVFNIFYDLKCEILKIIDLNIVKFPNFCLFNFLDGPKEEPEGIAS